VPATILVNDGAAAVSSLDATVRATGGHAEYVRFAKLWDTAGLLADVLPLDRAATYARPVRRAGHWLRLALWDRAIANPDRSAVLVVGRTPWVLAGAAAVGAAAFVPRSGRWQRRWLVVLAGALLLQRRRIADELALRRTLRDLAPDALLIEDLVARSPHAAVPWVRDLLGTLDADGVDTTFVALLPGAERDAVRRRIYTRRLGFEVAGESRSRGRTLTVLVRRPARVVS
jgi:hypothetical protein